MLFTYTGSLDSGCLRGRISRGGALQAAFHDRYMQLARALFHPAGGIIHPVVLDPWPFLQDGPVQERRVWDEESSGEPVLYSHAMRLIGCTQDGEDHLVVGIPPSLVEQPISQVAMLMVVVMDAASWWVSNTTMIEDLEWADGDVRMASIAARLLRAAEGAGLVAARDAADCYAEICSNALEALASRRYQENAQALLTRETPGLVTLLHDVVEAARTLQAPRLPVSATDQADKAVESVIGLIRDRQAGRSKAA